MELRHHHIIRYKLWWTILFVIILTRLQYLWCKHKYKLFRSILKWVCCVELLHKLGSLLQNQLCVSNNTTTAFLLMEDNSVNYLTSMTLNYTYGRYVSKHVIVFYYLDCFITGYFIDTYCCLVTHWPNSDSSLCQIGVIGVQDGTKLDITFPPSTGRGIINVEFEGVVYTNGDTLTVAINRYSTLQLQSQGKRNKCTWQR